MAGRARTGACASGAAQACSPVRCFQPKSNEIVSRLVVVSLAVAPAHRAASASACMEERMAWMEEVASVLLNLVCAPFSLKTFFTRRMTAIALLTFHCSPHVLHSLRASLRPLHQQGTNTSLPPGMMSRPLCVLLLVSAVGCAVRTSSPSSAAPMLAIAARRLATRPDATCP